MLTKRLAALRPLLIALLAVTGLTAADILRVRHRLKMHRIDARPVPAQVIYYQTFRDRAYVVFVASPVRRNKP